MLLLLLLLFFVVDVVVVVVIFVVVLVVCGCEIFVDVCIISLAVSNQTLVTLEKLFGGSLMKLVRSLIVSFVIFKVNVDNITMAVSLVLTKVDNISCDVS